MSTAQKSRRSLARTVAFAALSAFSLVLAASPVLRGGPPPAGAALADVELALARPQPEVPVCGRCNIEIPLTTVAFDDELTMVIDSLYKGPILAVTLTTFDAAGDPTTVSLDSSVVADLNDPTVEETTVMVDAPDAVGAQLTFVLDTGEQTEVIDVLVPEV